MIEVIHNLFQGSREDAIKVSQDGRVDAIIYLGQEMNEKKLTHESKSPVIHFPLNDGYNPKSRLGVLISVIDSLYRPFLMEQRYLLIACRYGNSRSPSIILLYLVERRGHSFDEAYTFIRKQIPNFDPKPELLNSIKEYLVPR